MALVVDTGPLYAFLDMKDRAHQRCLTLFENARESILIPSPVLVEVDHLISARLRPQDMAGFLQDIEYGNFVIADLVLEDYVRVGALIAQYADSDIGFVDAAVLAVVERLGEPKLATLDHRHFGFLRPRHVDSLQLLPE